MINMVNRIYWNIMLVFDIASVVCLVVRLKTNKGINMKICNLVILVASVLNILYLALRYFV